MKSVCLSGIVILFFIAAGISSASPAGELTEQVRQTTDKIISILNDPCMKGPDKEEDKINLIRELVYRLFDREGVSRRVLARQWRKLNDQEKKDFIFLFNKLLEQTYIGKIDNYSGQQIAYIGEKIDGKYGILKAKVLSKNDKDIIIFYKAIKKNSKWLVYDVSLEGVSLVNNYRTQFQSIIMQSSYDNLIKILKAKVNEPHSGNNKTEG